MAAITDKFNKAADGTGAYPSIASVTAARGEGGDILTCDDLSGWAKDTAVHFSTYRLLPDGTVDTNTQTDWKGIVVDNTITQMTRLAGAEDSGHLAGDKIELNPTIGWLDDLITGLLKSHNQDGTLKNNVVQTKNIAEAAITTEKLAKAAVKSDNVDCETLKINPLYMQTGSTAITIGSPGSAGLGATVNFAVPFKNTPKIIATLVNGSGTGASITTLSHSTTKFTALARFLVATSQTNSTFDWVAIDETQPPFISA